jgi:hypothetical protein
MKKLLILVSIIIVMVLFSSCATGWHAYKKNLFVPEHQSKVRKCMGYPYISGYPYASMKYFYSKRYTK